MTIAGEQLDIEGQSTPDSVTRIRSEGDALLAASNGRPASISVSCNLAEDTIIAGVMDIKEGRNSVAMFANPFVGGMEEMLYIDEQDTLRWARHINQPVTPDEHPLSGWTTQGVAGGIAEVVVAVHPNGTLWAFAVPVDFSAVLAFELVESLSVSGDYLWALNEASGVAGGPGPSGGLWVQYLNVRPATPVVFYVATGEKPAPRVYPITPIFASIPSGDPDRPRWNNIGSVPMSAEDVDGLGAVGFDGPDLNVLRLYALQGDGSVWRTTWWLWQPQKEPVREQIQTGWASIAGIWSSPQGAGFVGTAVDGPPDGHTQWLQCCYPSEVGGVPIGIAVSVPLDQKLDDIAIWQDAETLLHVYGRGSNGGLHVLHQMGWKYRVSDGSYEPVWDVHENGWSPYGPVGTTRALLADVARFDIDPFPDDMPNQHVMHSGVDAGETCALYTQQVGTSYWAREKMRLVPDTLPKPYVVPRYETSLTVLDSFGAAVPFCQISLTADAPVDLEVAGRFYRASQFSPVSLMTDAGGRVTLRTVAKGLAVPVMHVSAPGMAQALTIQQAAGVHRFLGGAGTLPNHPDGFTAQVVADAKKVDGSWLCPTINRNDTPDPWPPRASEVVAWCQGAFAVSSGSRLPHAMTAGLGDGEQVLSFSIQTHDPSRPGFQVYTTAEQLQERRRRLIEQGILESSAQWWGDIWQGIQAGVVKVAEFVVHVAEKAYEVLVELADGVRAAFIGAWNDVVSATHAVESAFVAVGAKIHEAIDWLKWAFSFHDIWETKTAFESTFTQFPTYMRQTLTWMRELGDDWFQGQEANIRQAFESMKADTAGRSTAGLASPALPEGKQPPTQNLIKDRARDPHVHWLNDHLARPDGPGSARPAPVQPSAVDGPFDALIAAIQSSPAWSDLSTAAQDLGDLFTNLFNFSDAQSLAAQEMSSFLDLFEHVLLAILEFGDTILDACIDFVEGLLDILAEVLSTPIESPLVELIYTFLQESAGVPADKVVKPTFGGIGALVAAFPGTILYKIIWNKAPFPGGVLPVLPIGDGPGPDLQALPAGVGGSIPPKAWELRATLQSYQAIMMMLDGPFDVLVDGSAFYKADETPWWLNPPQWFWVTAAVNHWIAYGCWDMPWVWGNTWPPNHPLDESILPYFSWFLSFVVNCADLGCAVKVGYFLVKFDDDKKGVGPFVLTLCGILRLIISGLRYRFIGTQSSTDLLNLWINLTSFESSATGFLRFAFKRNPELAELMAAKMLTDLVCDEFAGITTQYQTGYTNEHRPYVVVPVLPNGQVGQPYPSTAFAGVGGWEPYSWEMLPVEGKQFPTGLSMDPARGVLSGTPKIAGLCEFQVLLTDYSGPSFYFLTDTIEVRVAPAP